MNKEKAVLFDIGRVLIDVDFQGAARNVSAITGCGYEELWAWFEGASVLPQLEKGEVTPVEYFTIFKRELMLDISYYAFAECWNNTFTVNWDVV